MSLAYDELFSSSQPKSKEMVTMATNYIQVCMYVRMYLRAYYVCMYVCIYVRTYVCMYVCVDIWL